MSKGYSRAFFTVILLVFFSAAAHAGSADLSQFEPAQLKKNIVIGKTTSSQIKAIYGEPGSISRAPASQGGYDTEWTYDKDEGDTAGGKARKSVMGRMRSLLPFSNGTGTAADVAVEQGAGDRNTKRYVLDIEYDKKGVVTDYHVSESNQKKSIDE